MQQVNHKNCLIMKKIFTLLLIAGMASFIACGPSAKEKAEAAKQDSIRIADSIAKETAKADSIAQIAEKAKQDSIAKADSIANAEKTKAVTKTKTKAKKEVTTKKEEKKVDKSKRPGATKVK